MSPTHLRNTAVSLALFITGICAHSTAGAQPVPENRSATAATPGSGLPRDPWIYDQVTAQIPRKDAPIASVAMAKINLSLHAARRNVERTLCAGQWTLQGPVLHQEGPALDEADLTTDTAQESWHYNVLRFPQSLPCSSVSRTRFFLEMSRYLPEWIQIRPAGLQIAFQQGQAVLVQETVAVSDRPRQF